MLVVLLTDINASFFNSASYRTASPGKEWIITIYTSRERVNRIPRKGGSSFVVPTPFNFDLLLTIPNLSNAIRFKIVIPH